MEASTPKKKVTIMDVPEEIENNAEEAKVEGAADFEAAQAAPTDRPLIVEESSP